MEQLFGKYFTSICTHITLLWYHPAVPDVPTDCYCTALYSQPSGILLLINSSWGTVPVSHLHLANNWKYLLLVQMIKQLNVFTFACIRNMISVSLKKKGMHPTCSISWGSCFAPHCFSPGPTGPMSWCNWSHHTVHDQFPDWICCGYWECEHYQVHSWEMSPHLWATLKSSLKLWQCVSGCYECVGSGSCKNMYNTNHL